MNPNDRQRFKILFILLAVLVATVWVGREIYQVPSALPGNTVDNGSISATGVRESFTGVKVDADSLTGISPVNNEIGRNPFQYGREPASPAHEAGALPASTPGSGGTPQPPPPPPIPFRYNGYAVIDPSAGMTALLFDDEGSYAVSEEDVVMGRYRINVVTEAFVEVEDLEFGRHRRLPLITQ